VEDTYTYPRDDYRQEVTPRLNKSKIFNVFQKRCLEGGDPAGKDILALVESVAEYSYHRHKLVLRHMGEFTLHDAEHLFRVLTIMEYLIPDENLEKLSNADLMLLILTVFFHDIGMAPAESSVLAWLGVNSSEFTIQQQEENEKFNRFVAGREIKKREIDELRAEGKFEQADYLKRYLISEYIRITHAERSIEIIQQDWNGKIVYRDMNLTPHLALLCRSHNNESLKLLELDHLVPLGQQSFICLPFVGIVLRLADILDFDTKRTPTVLLANLFISDPISKTEWQKHRAVKNWTITSSYIGFTADCYHPAIEASIRKFCAIIDFELISCASVLANLHDSFISPFPSQYKIPLATKVDISRVKAQIDLFGKPKYIFRNTSFTLSKEQIIDILMGTKLYGQPNIALRELLQNSIDTCLLRNSMEKYWHNSYVPEISIIFSRTGEVITLKVIDNGVGMDEEIIDKFYSKIGTSYYKSSDFLELKSSFGSNYVPTSRFGIGILSCFMVSDSIEVETRRVYENHSYSNPLSVKIEGQESIFYIQSGSKTTPGTATTLVLRKDNPWTNFNSTDISLFIQKTIPFPPFNIKIIIDNVTYIHSPILPEQASLSEFTTNLEENANLKSYSIILDGKEGISGRCEVILIDEENMPKDVIESTSREFTINGTTMSFTSTIKIEPNEIRLTSKNIDTNSLEREIKTKTSNNTLRQSRSKISLHGIELPMSLFDHWNGEMYHRAKVFWPICIFININIGGSRDINLNSARTEILTDEKWIEFESTLARIILSNLKKQMTDQYWREFKRLMLTKEERYSQIFNQVLRELV